MSKTYKNYFPLPNVIFSLGLSPGEIAVYSYLLYCEDRKTYQCHPSYKTIGQAVGMSVNTVQKYIAGAYLPKEIQSVIDGRLGIFAEQEVTEISSLPYDVWKLWMITQDNTAPMAERDDAAVQLIEEAKGGDLHAQYFIGKLYQDGPVLVPDSVEALYWFEQAARQGHPVAPYELGKLLLSHDSEVHDSKFGLQWLEYAAHNKNDYAAYRLGKEYLKGVIVAKDTAKGVDYLTLSAEAGNQYAQYALGKIYLEAQEHDQAHYWFAQSAAQGNSHAQFFLSRWDSLKPPSVMLSVTRLLHHMSRVFQEQTPPLAVPGGIQADRKLMAKIREKKIALGHKPDDHEEYRSHSMAT